MASCRVTWVMAPPSLAALGALSARAVVALSDQWPPMSRRLIVRYPTRLGQGRDFMGTPARATSTLRDADLLCMIMHHIHASSYKEERLVSPLLIAPGIKPKPARRPAHFLSVRPKLGRALFVNLDSARRKGLRWRNAVPSGGWSALLMTCAGDIAATVVAVALFDARTCTACCTSPTATGLVLRTDASGYAACKTPYFVKDTGFSLTLSSRQRRHSPVVHRARLTVGDT